MTSRDFIRHLALLAAGAAAMPEQVDAFERIFGLNSPRDVETGLIQVSEFDMSGMWHASLPMRFEFSTDGRLEVAAGLNLYGGCYRWVATSDRPMRLTTLEGLRWKCTPAVSHKTDEDRDAFDAWWRTNFVSTCSASIRYMDQDGLWHATHITRSDGSLADEVLKGSAQVRVNEPVGVQ